VLANLRSIFHKSLDLCAWTSNVRSFRDSRPAGSRPGWKPAVAVWNETRTDVREHASHFGALTFQNRNKVNAGME